MTAAGRPAAAGGRALRVLALTNKNDRPEAALLRGLAAAGVGLEIVCHPGSSHRESFERLGIPVHPLEVRSRLDRRATRAVRRWLEEGSFDLFHAFTNKTLATGLRAARGLDVRSVGYRGTVGHLHRWDPASRLTYFHPRLDRVSCVSDAVREHLVAVGIPPERAVTVRKGHDPEWYAPPAEPVARQALGVPADAFLVGFLGNMRPVKGVDVLIEAAARLPASSRVHLLLVGDVRHRGLRRRAAEARVASRVTFTGPRPDGPALLSATDLFVLPSVAREGLPKAAVEAMAQGLPVIASAVGGLPELIGDDEGGLLVPPRDPDALAAAIGALEADPERRAALGRAARARIEARFRVEQTVEATLALYEGLLASPPRADR